LQHSAPLRETATGNEAGRRRDRGGFVLRTQVVASDAEGGGILDIRPQNRRSRDNQREVTRCVP